MRVECSNERPEGVWVSKACGCRGLVGIEGVVEGMGIAALRVHGHERTHSCVLRSGVRCYIINGQMGGTHLDHTSSSSLASSSSSLMLIKFRWRTGAASTGGWDNERRGYSETRVSKGKQQKQKKAHL